MAREIIYPAFVVMLIATVWALGWEKSHTDALEHGLGPAITQNDWQYEGDADEARSIVTTDNSELD